MIGSLLIANRGEIACRIIRTARRLGIRTIAVYSDADAGALHVRQADEAVHIGASPARASYLVGEKIIAAARSSGAEAVHPGYGFRSESAEFAEAVIAAGLIWVGPKPVSIRAMGPKDAAKKLMIAAGVPVTPGYLGEDQSPVRLRREADAISYPVLIKAVAGGGGKGMRVVESAIDFSDALESCRREALASFGDDHVLIEKYIQRPRHIEVQVFGDNHGDLVHLFERDCSLQRRHQKIIEEAPAPGMDDATREWLCATAVKAARAVDYVSAGTIEFIADASDGLRADRLWFMEMNTRLQVEHPVTEAITGQDLVEWQLRVASGEPLPKSQDALRISGHAIEARLYAEDPGHGFLPSIGRLEHFRLPEDEVRIDTGVAEGSGISEFYDPMIAKLTAWDATRRGAASRLCNAVRNIEVWPVKTNAGFLARALNHPEFVAGNIDTGFIARYGDDLIPPAEPAAELLRIAAWRLTENLARSAGGAVWRRTVGFRVNRAPAIATVKLLHEGRIYETSPPSDAHARSAVTDLDGGVLISAEGQSFFFTLARAGGSFDLSGVSDGAVLSPIPGSIVAVEIAEGDQVKRGQKLVVLSAMKMELALNAPFDGIVADLKAVAGTNVSEGIVLLRVEKKDSP